MSEPSQPDRFELLLADELARYAAPVRDPRPTADIAAAATATRRRWWSFAARPRTLVPVMLLLGLATAGAVVAGQLIRDQDSPPDRSTVAVPSPLDSADLAEPLVRRDWSLQGVATDGQLAPATGTLEATLRIDGRFADGLVDCRGYTSHVAIDGGSISLRDLGSTSDVCPGAAASREAGYLRDLGSVTAWSVADGMLTLSDPAGAPLLAYVPTPPADLSGIWAVGVVVGADGRQIAMPVPMSMWFGGGRITTTVGCAGIEARYVQDGVAVRITDVTVMDGQCQGPAPAADALRSALQASGLVDTDGYGVLLLDTQRATRIILTPTRPPGSPVPASPAP